MHAVVEQPRRLQDLLDRLVGAEAANVNDPHPAVRLRGALRVHPRKNVLEDERAAALPLDQSLNRLVGDDREVSASNAVVAQEVEQSSIDVAEVEIGVAIDHQPVAEERLQEGRERGELHGRILHEQERGAEPREERDGPERAADAANAGPAPGDDLKERDRKLACQLARAPVALPADPDGGPGSHQRCEAAR